MTGNLNTPGQAALFRNTCCFCDRAAFSHPSHGQEPCVADYPYAKIYLVRKSVSTDARPFKTDAGRRLAERNF